ncbi:hypothetical protein PJL15_00378 [Paenarthrobacter nitroguajacolicus]|nr:hypothetical protein [Paenarthrobacter nitroguajacolicus]
MALTRPGIEVDNFVTLGSAGLPDNVHTAADLNAGHVYPGHARDKIPGETESGDQWAWTGREGSRDHHVNPIEPEFSSHAFGTDTGGDARQTAGLSLALRIRNAAAIASDSSAEIAGINLENQSIGPEAVGYDELVRGR